MTENIKLLEAMQLAIDAVLEDLDEITPQLTNFDNGIIRNLQEMLSIEETDEEKVSRLWKFFNEEDNRNKVNLMFSELVDHHKAQKETVNDTGIARPVLLISCIVAATSIFLASAALMPPLFIALAIAIPITLAAMSYGRIHMAKPFEITPEENKDKAEKYKDLINTLRSCEENSLDKHSENEDRVSHEPQGPTQY